MYILMILILVIAAAVIWRRSHNEPAPAPRLDDSLVSSGPPEPPVTHWPPPEPPKPWEVSMGKDTSEVVSLYHEVPWGGVWTCPNCQSENGSYTKVCRVCNYQI